MNPQLASGTASRPAHLALQELGSIWFQVTGLLCNLECTHCLVDSSPRNKTMAFLERETIRRRLAEADALGVKEIYFTGGEPFLHPEMTDILADALAVGPTTVLTNGILVTERLAASLAGAARASRYSLEIRVSLDHPDPERNDAVRGTGAHAKAVRAVRRLEAAGLLPIVTATEYLMDPPPEASEGGRRSPGRSAPPEGMYDAFHRMLRDAGVRRPRLKIMPVFRVGKLEDPADGGAITEDMMEGLDPMLLQCGSTRVVTADGIYACPILVGKRVALMGRGDLAGALGAAPLTHHACRTCYDTGMTCGNF